MSGYRQGKRSWMDDDFYPVRERLVGSFVHDKDAVLLVDVGGGLGHDLAEFKTKHVDINPGVRARLILQDKPDVIGQIKPETANGLELSGHDFFTEQPSRGKSLLLFSQACTITHKFLLAVSERSDPRIRVRLTTLDYRGQSLLLAFGPPRLG